MVKKQGTAPAWQALCLGSRVFSQEKQLKVPFHQQVNVGFISAERRTVFDPEFI